MRFLVFGAGAMGSLVGGLLSTRHEVTLVARAPHAEAVRERGLRIRGRTELVAWPRAVEDAAQAEPPDVIVVTVKSYHTAEAARALAPLAGAATVLSLQNGLGNVERLVAAAPRLLAGVTYHGVTFVEPGEILHAGLGETVLGPAAGTTLADARRVGEALAESGLAVRVTDATEGVLWGKAVVNACFNPLTGLLKVRSGALGRSAHLLEVARDVIDEAVRVAATKGVALDASELVERVRAVSSATAQNRSSMLQDLERGRPTEIDAINGWIAEAGAAAGIACPVNRTLTLLVRAAEARAVEEGAPG